MVSSSTLFKLFTQASQPNTSVKLALSLSLISQIIMSHVFICKREANKQSYCESYLVIQHILAAGHVIQRTYFLYLKIIADYFLKFQRKDHPKIRNKKQWFFCLFGSFDCQLELQKKKIQSIV